MRLLLWLLRSSWRIVLLAGLIGGFSGAASVAMVALILHTLRAPDASSGRLVALFAGLCAVVLLTRIVSQTLLYRLAQNSMSQLRMSLCQRILDTPLRQLEEIGSHRLLAALTGDVSIVSRALNGVPVLAVNLVILACGAVYLGSLSLSLMVGAVAFGVVGVASYWGLAAVARRYVEQARKAQDLLLKRIQSLIEGVKELKMHRPRRQIFVGEVLTAADTSVRESQFVGDCLYDGAVAWGRLTFFIAIGMLLFVWPKLQPVDAATLTGYAITILYLMSPLEQIMGWLPLMGWATISARQIETLGLMLDQGDRPSPASPPPAQWQQIELAGVTHSYQRDGKPHGFLLGPLELTLQRGEVVFIIGGNGSGKTTLGKLLTGLYTPESGQIRLDGVPVTDANREAYRQLFSVVCDDAVVFDSLWGLDAADLDRRARAYLAELELDHLVSVTDGAFSTTALSRGQRKRLALLTAYLENRPIYVFDEWAADQDPVFRKVFYRRLLPELKRQGKAVVAITHDDRYFDCADRVVKLDEGQIVA